MSRPAGPRGFMQLDATTFQLVIPNGVDIEFPPSGTGYATAVTARGRFCRWIESEVAVS